MKQFDLQGNEYDLPTKNEQVFISEEYYLKLLDKDIEVKHLENQVLKLKQENKIISDLSLKNMEEINDKLDETVKKRNQLQSNWNSLREWLKRKIDNFEEDVSTPILHEQMTIRVIYEHMENLDKMNELEGKDNNENRRN